MDLREAAGRFRTAMKHCDNLVTLHRAHGGPSQGRRAEEVSINRAVVVLAVASWQAAVQDIATAALDAGQPAEGQSILLSTYQVVTGVMNQQIGNFSTPNPENTRRLLGGVGFDPRPFWTWKQMGGQGIGVITITPSEAETKMAEWLRLRHEIAHGEDHLSRVSVLQAVRENKPRAADWSPQIRLVDAEACMAFFRRVSQLTGEALALRIGQSPGRWDQR
jgi:hypothetical protein